MPTFREKALTIDFPYIAPSSWGDFDLLGNGTELTIGSLFLLRPSPDTVNAVLHRSFLPSRRLRFSTALTLARKDLYLRNLTAAPFRHRMQYGKRNQYPPPRLPVRPL